MQAGTHSSSVGGLQSTELGGGDPALGLFANPGLVYTSSHAGRSSSQATQKYKSRVSRQNFMTPPPCEKLDPTTQNE